MPRPENNHYYAPYFQRYIDYTKGNSIAELIANHEQELNTFYNSIPEEKSMFAYEANKWTVKEVLQHIIDCERVFMYRALHIARKDTAPLSSFDENSWAENSLANGRTLASLKEEFNALRKSTIALLQSFTDNQLLQKGIAGNNEIDVNALAYITFGHALHHKKILQEKYF
jgi:uncharacterized damage-inducible protein DinB